MKKFKSGFVAVIGRANVGKSTFINRVIGQKVTITSDKAQTTRRKTNCIFNSEDAQIIFIDSPGFLKPKNLLTKRLNHLIVSALSDVDLIVDMVDVKAGIGSGDHFVFDFIKGYSMPKLLLLNKIDSITKGKLEKERMKIGPLDLFDEVIPISAIQGDNIQETIQKMIELLPEGPMYYPEDILSDTPLRRIAADIVREKLMDFLFDELPHAVTTEIETFEETKTKKGEDLLRIECVVIAEKESHKSIIIGKRGAFLKKIGQSAREEIEELTGKKVYLNLWVKISKDWTKDENAIRLFGY